MKKKIRKSALLVCLILFSRLFNHLVLAEEIVQPEEKVIQKSPGFELRETPQGYLIRVYTDLEIKELLPADDAIVLVVASPLTNSFFLVFNVTENSTPFQHLSKNDVIDIRGSLRAVQLGDRGESCYIRIFHGREQRMVKIKKTEDGSVLLKIERSISKKLPGNKLIRKYDHVKLVSYLCTQEIEKVH